MTSHSISARAVGRGLLKSLPAVAILCVPMSVQAQIAPGQSGSSSQYSIEGQEVLDTVANYGRCYASMNRRAAIALVATRPGSPEEAKVYRQLFNNQNQSCLGNVTQLRMPHGMVRGAIAEGLYHSVRAGGQGDPALLLSRTPHRGARPSDDAGGGEMIRRRIILLVAIGVIAAPAQAARTRNPRIPSWEQSHLDEGAVAMRALYILAVCTRNHRLEQAEAMLRARPGTPEEWAATPLIRPPGQDECLMRTTELRIRNRDLFRGAIAEAIYNGRRVQPLSTAPLPLNVQAVMPRNEQLPAARIGARSAGACAVERAPALTHRVVQLNPGSIAEFKALIALDSTFLSCIPAGSSLQVSRLSIRANIAEALYQAWRARPDLFKAKAAK